MNIDINSKLKSSLFIITLTTLTMLLYSFATSTIYAEHDAASQSGNNMGNSMGNMGDMGSMMGNMMGGMMSDMTMPMALDVIHNDPERPEVSKNYTGTYVMEGMFMGFPYWVKNNCIAEQTIREGRCYIFVYYGDWVLQPSPPGTNINGETRLYNDITYAEWPWMGGWVSGNVQSVSISNNMDMGSMMGNMMGGMMSGGMGMPNTTNQNNTNQYSTPMVDTGYQCKGEPRVIFYDERLLEALLDEFDNQGITFSASGNNCDDTSVTLSSVLELTKADLSNKGITSLEGIEYATNLTALRLNNNEISDIDLLLSLTNLRTLDMRDNMIVVPDQDPRYPPQENPLTLLQRNGVSTDVNTFDISTVFKSKYNIDLANLPNVSQQQLADILWGEDPRSLVNASRTQPSSSQNQQNTGDYCDSVSDFTRFQDNSLWTSIINQMKTQGLTFCSSPQDLSIDRDALEEITFLEANFQNIINLNGIETLRNLEELRMHDNRITNIEPLGNLRSLMILDLSNNQICQSNYNPWDNLRGLRIVELFVSNACISGLDFTDDLINLRFLDINGNPISQSYKIQELINRGVEVEYNGNINTNQQSSQNNSNFNNSSNNTTSNSGSSFYYEEEGNSRGFLFNVDEVPEWAQNLGLNDVNQLLDPTVIAIFGIFITLLGTVAQMARGR